MTQSRLFMPLKIGNMDLRCRIAMAPLTRYRAHDDHTPSDLMATYYGQRASIPGTLLISEGTFISARAGGYSNVPGIYTESHIEGWRKVTDEVHRNSSYIVCQLWSLGRAANPEVAKRENIQILGPSPISIDPKRPVPRQMDHRDIQLMIEDYAQAARNAIAAGFDAVELHGANGYIIDQFLQTNTNERSDEYGGDVERRSRFGLEAVRAVIDAVGAKRVGIRLSPWSTFNGMRMEDPIPQFRYFIRKLSELDLAYLHLVEPRIAGNMDVESADSLDFAIQEWKNPLLLAGGYVANTARTLVDEKVPERDVVVTFGRYFISTPDLPFRIQKGLELTQYDRATFYTPQKAEGYVDYAFSKAFLDQQTAEAA
ncbi:hypothetical protein PV10_05243 [Exophiala mesophila]|uniref:NADH:flavin oxidoreductase/NADH oxidase N-terminal domain-containing protein n=1 Tax=Exophiala mesophila TaxID=212818 RepID=A0A0D1ZHK2_EXOME|nr:uncharacterized protein PV10_05243 [Exophiala mesophila]KIV94087.1 hypothetical protein PV10_05243 [Exophiala mesophila]